jgi:hypothetical protein
VEVPRARTSRRNARRAGAAGERRRGFLAAHSQS